jgi:hypothetical protein
MYAVVMPRPSISRWTWMLNLTAISKKCRARVPPEQINPPAVHSQDV